MFKRQKILKLNKRENKERFVKWQEKKLNGNNIKLHQKLNWDGVINVK